MDSENSTRDDGTNNQPITENESPTSNIDHTVKNSPESELNTQTKFESQTNAVNSNVSDYECSNVDNNQTENTVPPLGASHEETKSGVESMDVVKLQCDQVLSNTDVNTNENPSIISPPETITDESIKKVPDNTEQNLSSIQVSKLNQLDKANSETSVNKSNLNTESNFHPGHPKLSNLPSDTDKIDCKTKDSSNENNVLTIFDTSNTNLDQKEINAVESNDKTCLMDKSNNPSDSTKIICESETMLVDTNIHDVENHISTYPTTDVSSEKADAMEVDVGASLSNTSVDSNEVNTSVENIATELVSPGVQLSINDTVDVKQIPDEPNSCKQDNNYETIKSNVADLNLLPEDPSMSKAWDPEETDKINEIKIPIPEKYAVHEETIKSDVNEAPKSPSLKSIENSEIKEHENIPEEDTLQNDPNQCTNDAKNSAEVPKINSFENSETVSDHKEQNITHTKTIDGEEKTKEHIIEPISMNQIESSVELSTLDTKEQESVDSDEEESVDSKKNKHVKEIENVDLKEKESVYSEEKKESDLKVKESVDSSKNISVDLKEKDSVHSIEKESVDPIEKESVDSSENISADLKEKHSVHSIEKESVDSSENISVHLKEKDSVHSIAKESVDSSENISVDLKEKDSDHSIEKEIVDSNGKESIDSKETQSVDANESKSVLSKEIEHSVLKEEESTVSKEKVSVDSSENESVDLKENESDDSKKNDGVDLKEKESVDSNETDVSKNKETLDCKEKEMIDPTETESLDSKEKDSIEPSSETSPNEEIVSENSADPAALSVELLLEKNKGKENAIVLEENIEVSGENVSNKIGDLEILPEAGRNKSDKILSSNNKNGDSKTQIKVETKTILDSVSEISKIEIVENSDKNKGDLPGDEEMSRRLKNKEGNKDSMTKIDDTVIYKKFECKPLTIRADINMEEFQKLKSAPDILSEPSVPMKTHDENIKDKEELIKSSEVDLEIVDGEKPKKTRSTAKSLEKPIERLKSKPKKIITASTSKTKDKEEIPNIKDKEEVPKKNKDKNEVPKKIKDKEEVSKRIKEKEETSRKNKEKESQKKTQENIVESPVEEDKPKIKCKKLDIQETKKDTREPSKRLIIKTQSSINESVQSTKKSSQADAVDLEVVDEKYTKNPMRMYEVCKELRKMVRSQMSKKDSKVAALKSQYQLEELTLENIGKIDIIPKSCDSCKLMKLPAYKIVESFKTHLFCSMVCGIRFKLRRMDLIPAQVKRICCGHCNKIVVPDEKSLSWKTNNYCDDKCLSKAFQMLGDTCGNCNTHIPIKLRGRYILQRGNIKAIFCSSMCRAYHKSAFKYCTICNKISDGARMTTVNKYKICSQECLRKFTSYKKTQGNMACCTVCHINKPIQYNVLSPGEPVHHLCSEKCFKAFNFVNKLDVVQCNLCERYFDKVRQEDTIFCFFSDLFHNFCSRFCHYIYMREARGKKTCAWCKGEKNEPSMVRRVYEDQEYFYCTVTCLNMLNVEKSVTAKAKQCDYCKSYSTDTFYVSSYSATSSFCTYKCVYNFHNNFPCTKPLQNSSNLSKIVISDVRSLNAANAFQPPAPKPIAPKPPVRVVPNKIIKPKYEVTKILPRIIRQILVKPQEKKDMKNAATQVHPTTSTKRVSCKTTSVTKDCQTGEDMGRPSLIPVPVPLYVPSPAAMYSAPFPVLVPIPIPVPVPIFIPTTRNSAAGIFKEIKRIQEKIPADPFEAELLMMAEMVASDKKDEGGTTDDDSNAAEDEFDNEGGTMESSNNAFGEDVLQMAIKMACNDLEPSGALQGVDLDDALQPATITITQTAPRSDNNAEDIDAHDAMFRGANRGGRKRGTSSKAPISRAPPMKRQRRTSDIIPTPPAAAPAPPPPMELEKPDANMCLKYTFGVNAWRQWVVEKNQELEKAATAAAGNRKPTNIKLFKPEILQLTADELNFSLCLFVQEVRKPNGTQYAPDTIYYLCLGIQQYLFESGRIDNIFTDPYYEKFTEALDEVCCKFSALYNDTQFIVTRVEEEHLWESKQLGAHSPHVLLNTLMFFNTKHFNLITVEEHMQLSFSHIMKHWKRNPSMAANIATNCTKAPPGSRNVLLRFYPPQSAIDAPGSRKKKVYEQQENEENPLRCPVRLYEFYLSKCPESVKTRNDVFYLLPERSCVPDSPVWYSTTPLNKEALMKMLHRIKMVKEINIAFLSL